MLLDLGCGTKNTKAPGHIGIDIVKDADIVWDLNKGLPKDSIMPYSGIEGIRCHQTIEHLDTIIPLMNDCYQVMKEGAMMEISTPKGGTDAFWQDPTHKKGYVWETFLYFMKDSQFPEAQEEYGITARFSKMDHWIEHEWNLQIRLTK